MRIMLLKTVNNLFRFIYRVLFNLDRSIADRAPVQRTPDAHLADFTKKVDVKQPFRHNSFILILPPFFTNCDIKFNLNQNSQ